MREAVFVREMREDLAFWITRNPRTGLRVVDLVEAALREPRVGIGKPEHLRYRCAEVWSRRVTDADRLVYEIQADHMVFLRCRSHYAS